MKEVGDLEFLLGKFPRLEWERDFSFARHTTIGCGGRAALAVTLRSAVSAAELLRYLDRESVPYCFLGAGANVLPADGYFEGVVVRFGMNGLLREGERVFAGAGATGGSLCRSARANGVGGFEPFTGIPMTVGGGITMNAGVREGHFSDVTECVIGIEKGKIRSFSAKECAFGEKTSLFQRGVAVVGAYLRGRRASPAEIADRTAYFREKRAHLPKGRSMGCVFVNPEGDSAGRLIEACGLKGRSVGGARVSGTHANFIVGEGASSADVAWLIELVRAEVLAKTGILLREEIRRIP